MDDCVFNDLTLAIVVDEYNENARSDSSPEIRLPFVSIPFDVLLFVSLREKSTGSNFTNE